MVWLHYKESAVHSLLLETLGRHILMDLGCEYGFVRRHHKKKEIGKFWLATVCCFRTIPKPYLPKSSLCVFLDEKTFDDWKDMKNDSECGIKRTSLQFQPGVMVTWWLQMYCKICIFFSLLFLCDMYKIQFIFYIPTRKLLFLFRQLTSWCPLHCE